MLKDKSLTYVSLFSSAGVGCYGFKMEGYHCVATNELHEKRLDVQRANKKCDFESGYISGDISAPEVKDEVYAEVERWEKLGNDRVDVVIATPPCQGISVINHKKNESEVKRNSLIVESIELVKRIAPRFFVFENVMAFQKTLCSTPAGELVPIGSYILDELGGDYVISGRVLNFMNYGSNSSRTRTLVLGVSREYRDSIVPYELYPRYRKECTLRDVVGDYPELSWGEINSRDFYHAFRTYKKSMRCWIHDLKEGESAFDNEDLEKRPHRVVKGIRVENARKSRDKYTRQKWDRFPQCIHTRNDLLAAQNTIHPEQDRVFSIRELMDLMTIPRDFKWVPQSVDELNALPEEEKRAIYRVHEMNIRQCLGEAVPTEVFRHIARVIKDFLTNGASPRSVSKIIAEHHLEDGDALGEFLKTNPLKLNTGTLMRVVELCNSNRERTAAYYTNKFLVNEIVEKLPSLSGKETVHILEPSVGAGGFLPFLFRKYENVPSVILDVVDIDEDSIRNLKLLLKWIDVPSNFEIRVTCGDFLEVQFPYRFDLVVGNPPFTRVDRSLEGAKRQAAKNINKETSSLAEYFLEKCLAVSDYVSLVLNKNILSADEFRATRDWLRTMRIDSIIDFGRYGFTGVSIETICLMVSSKGKPEKTHVYNVKRNLRIDQNQRYITDDAYPCFLIYRDSEFDRVADKLRLGVFDVYRDRQITKSLTTKERKAGFVWVLKAKNINDDGSGVSHIDDYDVYIDAEKLSDLTVSRYMNDKTVYLTPNMTYRPRVIDNPSCVTTDGSVAVLIPRKDMSLTEQQKRYFSTSEYRRFYEVARNYATQSINVDKTAVFFYGALKDE